MDLSDNHVFHLFVIRTNNRQELQDYLLKKRSANCNSLSNSAQTKHCNNAWAVFSYYRENAWWSVEYTVESYFGEQVDFIITL
jgi:hypothetical protein